MTSARQIQLDRLTYNLTDVKHGGMGSVWLLERPTGANWDLIYGRKLAVKTFNADEDAEEVVIEQELGNWVNLHSEFIVPLIKIARLNFQLAAMMPLHPGSLGDYIRRYGALPDSKVVAVLLDILRGLEYVHKEHQLAHLDLKPENLLMRSLDPPRVEISDWGISKLMSANQAYADFITAPKAWLARQTEDKTAFGGGTYPYMAPERFSGAWTVQPAVDIFSVGMIAVFVLTGRSPFDGAALSPLGIAQAMVSGEYMKYVADLLASAPTRLTPFIVHCLQPHVKDRPSNYPELIDRLEKQ